ncbi:ribosome-binding protein 1-like isoform X4 [Saccostrea echinata]|uniref:ribosome-binding protein 1-like isoform X4 n=1 Tax=Saccostrea echinata TaxID=191078 RepID=UPI002A82E274|nr:ribosome-binding protein 1-like isoform X4 [Saccostrea echinata]
MDPHVVLIGVTVFIVSAILIYLISVFGIKEKSYEEAIAEQKKRFEEEQEKARRDKKAGKEKKEKKGGKTKKDKPKEKVDEVPKETKEVPKEHKMVNLEIEAEIIEPIDVPLETSKSLPNLKQRKHPSKSILANKDEKPLIAKETVEVPHFKPPPKDELDLKHKHEREGKRKDSKTEKPESPKSGKKQKPVEEDFVVEHVSKVTAAATESKQKRSKLVQEPLIDASDLIMSVRTAQLGDQDTQTLIDILLNKQGGGGGGSISTEWNKKSQKGDPIVLLRRQLEEKERALQEEQNLAMSNANKIKEIRQELAHEKTRFTNLEQQYQEKITAQTQEIQALHARMQSTHESHLIENSRMQAHINKLEQQAQNQGQLQQLKEENRKLKESYEKIKAEAIPPAEFNSLRQKVSIMENELSNNVIKLNSAEKAKNAAMSKCSKLEEEIKKLKGTESDSEGMWTKRLEEVNQQLRKSENEKKTLADRLKTAEKDCAGVKARLQELEKALNGNDASSKELEEKLKTTETAKASVESSLKTTEKKLQEIENQKNNFQQELENLKMENKKLLEEAKVIRERPLGDGQEAPKAKPNGDILSEEKAVQEYKDAMEEYKKTVAEKDKTIQSLQSDVDIQKKEAAKLLEQVEAQKKKNNELREKNWKAMDALEKAEKSASDKITRVEKEVKEQSTVAVTETEKYDKNILQRLFPEISVSDKMSHKDWMNSFEKEAAVQIKAALEKKDDSAKLKELEDSKNSLQMQVTDLKKKVSESAKLEARVKELESQNTQLQKQLGDSKTESSSQITAAQNLVKDLQEQVKQLEKENKEYKSKLDQSSSNDSQVQELEEANRKLQKQVEDYLAVLQTTETKLQQLENSVEGEERKWQDKAEALTVELKQAKDEIASLKQDVDKYKNSEEAETRISSLQSSIQQSNTADLTKELQDLKSQLDAEMKKSKDLASQVVRLNGIIKTGQDAIQQEQELVTKLKQQLEEREKSPGTNSNSTVSELKVKLDEKEKQLEKEITLNKQLSQRLGQLGIMAKSPSDSGTSV